MNDGRERAEDEAVEEPSGVMEEVVDGVEEPTAESDTPKEESLLVEVHYIAEHGWMLHAVPNIDVEAKGSSDPTEVTCQVCLGLLQPPIHYADVEGRPLHPIHGDDPSSGDEDEVTCSACQTLLSAAALDAGDPGEFPGGE